MRFFIIFVVSQIYKNMKLTDSQKNKIEERFKKLVAKNEQGFRCPLCGCGMFILKDRVFNLITLPISDSKEALSNEMECINVAVTICEDCGHIRLFDLRD